jgi:hypothetical protein
VKLRTAGGGIARVDLFWEEARLVIDWTATPPTPRAAIGRQRPSARRGSGWRDGTSCRSRMKT